MEFEVENRGKWRKFNPYNPYVDDEENKPKDLKVDSLDDLFEEEDNTEESEGKAQNNSESNENDNLKSENIAPILPQNEEEDSTNREEDEIMSLDVQKELEAKFDELFGAFDDEDENK